MTHAHPLKLPAFALLLAIPFRGLAQGDTCTTALEVSNGLHLANGPTSGSPGPACGSGQDGDWYRYVPNFNGMVIVTSCHPLNNMADDDTYLKVFQGTCDNLVCVDFNDDAGSIGCPGYAFASHMQFNVTAGTTYFIVWTDPFDDDEFWWELRECAGSVTGVTYRDVNANGQRDAGEPQVDAMLTINPGGMSSYLGEPERTAQLLHNPEIPGKARGCKSSWR